ncbi:MAG: hypothetical protein EOO68_23835, partial [Moraxellaceae bacterium]
MDSQLESVNQYLNNSGDVLIASQQARIDAMVNTGLVGAGSVAQLVVDASGKTQQVLNDAKTLKNADWVNIKDFGGVGDGLVDDTAAFIAAINKTNRLELERGKTYLVNSQYSLNKPLYIRGNDATITGTSNGTISGTLFKLSGDASLNFENVKVKNYTYLVDIVGIASLLSITFKDCHISNLKRMVYTNTSGSLALNFNRTVFTLMQSVIWGFCAVKTSWFTACEISKIKNDPLLAEHQYTFKLGNDANRATSGIMFFRNCTFSDIEGGAASGSGYVSAIFSATMGLIVEGCTFEDIKGSDTAVEHRSRAIYAYGSRCLIRGNTFVNAGRYAQVTVKLGDELTNQSVISDNTFQQDYPLTNSGVHFEAAFNGVVANNTFTGGYARMTIGSTGYQYGNMIIKGNIFDVTTMLSITAANMRNLTFTDNLFKRSGRYNGAEDNVIRLFTGAGFIMSDIKILNNTFDTPDTQPVSGISPRAHIDLANAGTVARLYIAGNSATGSTDASYKPWFLR